MTTHCRAEAACRNRTELGSLYWLLIETSSLYAASRVAHRSQYRLSAILALSATLLTCGCSEQVAPFDSVVAEYGRTLSPDGRISAFVYHKDSRHGGQSQLMFDFVGSGCGSGSAAWPEFDLGIELHWVDSNTLEVTYPDGKSYRQNASGDFLVCGDGFVRVIMVPRGRATQSGRSTTKPTVTNLTASPRADKSAYAIRYNSLRGGITQVVIDFEDTRGCSDSAVTFYDPGVDLRLEWTAASELTVHYPQGEVFDLPPWGAWSRCVSKTVELKMKTN